MLEIDALSLLIQEGIRRAVAKAIAEHEREGRGDMVRAAQANPDGSLPVWPAKAGAANFDSCA